MEVSPSRTKSHGSSHMRLWTLSIETIHLSWIPKRKNIKIMEYTSGINMTMGVLVSGSNSVLFASCRPRTDRAYSMTAICIPRQMPRYGTLFSRAYLAARIFPCTPRSPKPPGTRTPLARCRGRPFRKHVEQHTSTL